MIWSNLAAICNINIETQAVKSILLSLQASSLKHFVICFVCLKDVDII